MGRFSASARSNMNCDGAHEVVVLDAVAAPARHAHEDDVRGGRDAGELARPRRATRRCP